MGKLTGESTSEIDAPIDEVYAICADVATAPDWQDGMKRLTPTETDDEGRATLAEVALDAKVKEVKTIQRFTYEPPHAVRWTQVKGDMKAASGAWLLEDLGDNRTRATFAAEIDPGRILSLAIRGPIESVLRAMMVGARAGELKQRVEEN